MVAVVVVVLAANLMSGLVPGMDALLAAAPVLVLVLVAGTLVVMLRVALRGRGGVDRAVPDDATDADSGGAAPEPSADRRRSD
jgi:hypothetical protein